MQTRAFILSMAAVTAFSATLLAEMPTAFAADLSTTGVDAPTKKQVRAENRALSHAVRQSFTHTRGLDASRINVVSRGSTVTLAGSAPDQVQIEAAGAAASKVAGVGRVDNRLTVSEPGH